MGLRTVTEETTYQATRVWLNIEGWQGNVELRSEPATVTPGTVLVRETHPRLKRSGLVCTTNGRLLVVEAAPLTDTVSVRNTGPATAVGDNSFANTGISWGTSVKKAEPRDYKRFGRMEPMVLRRVSNSKYSLVLVVGTEGVEYAMS